MSETLILPLAHYIVTSLISIVLLLPVYFLIFRSKLQRFERSCESEVNVIRQQLAQLDQDKLIQLHQRELDIAKLYSELTTCKQQMAFRQEEIDGLNGYKERCIQIETKFEQQQLHQTREKQLLEETKGRLFKEFELVANKLFDAKQQQFATSSRTNIESVLNPFKEQLRDFHKRVEDVYHKENSERNRLVGQIAELQKQTQQISSDANNLATALKGDNKAQGNWGEIILERLLEQSGLERGREYETQKTHSDEVGKKFKPDVIVHLPEGKDIVIDAKVSLLDYERFCQEAGAAEKELALKKHVDSLRTHIKGLSRKKYENLEGIRTLDFVFIFVPVEAAYIAAIQSAPALFKEAYDNNIVLVSPSSLMVALRTVETLWRYEKQNNNAEKIAQSAGKLYDQFVMLLSSIDDIGKFLDKASEAYDTTRKRLVDGRGNVVKRVETLRGLGAKTSRHIPASIKDAALECDGDEGGLPPLDEAHAEVEENTEGSDKL